MTTLHALLETYNPTSRKLGLGRPSAGRLSDTQRDDLRQDLERLGARNDRIVWVLIVMLVVLFIVSIGVIVLNLDRPKVAAAAGTALGLSAAGCIRWLLQVWREKTATEQLLQLAISLEGEALAAIIATLTRRAATAPDLAPAKKPAP